MIARHHKSRPCSSLQRLFLPLPSLDAPLPALQDEDGGSGAGAGTTGAGAGGVTVANADAERTLLRIKQKLEGTEFGEAARGVVLWR